METTEIIEVFSTEFLNAHPKTYTLGHIPPNNVVKWIIEYIKTCKVYRLAVKYIKPRFWKDQRQ